MLTDKQKNLLLFIQNCLEKTGTPPSFEEMKRAANLKSKSGIHRLILSLEERGFIRRLPNRARAIEILRLPEDLKSALSSSSENVISFSKPPLKEKEIALQQKRDIETVPFYGKIAAGLPIEALRNENETIEIPPSMLGRGDYYALEISGDSMIEAGILDGDVVVIERCDTAQNGDIVVALVDSEEVTLKYFRKYKSEIALVPANKSYETRVFDSSRIQVQGKLANLIRNYH